MVVYGLRFLIVGKDPTIATIKREKRRTTIVLINVATLLSVFLIPHFASIDVMPAKKAERNAKTTHI